MKKPEVSIGNYPAVFEHYDQHGPNPAFARFGHFVMSKAFKPYLEIEDNSQNQIYDHLMDDYLTMIVTNHDSDVDQYNLAGFVGRVPALRPMISKTVIMAKMEVFNLPGKSGKLKRHAVDLLGSYPVVRSKDLPEDATDQDRFDQHNASELSIQLGFNKTARDGYHIAGFPEGQRTPKGEDCTIVRPLKRGFGEIYMNAINNNRKLMIVTAGMFYGTNEMQRNYKTPDIHIGQPIIEQLTSAEEVTELMHSNIQRDLDKAVANRLSRDANS